MLTPESLGTPNGALEYYQTARDIVLSSIEPDTEGLDIDRVKNFAAANGLPETPFLITTKENYHPKMELVEYLENYDYTWGGQLPAGWYNPDFEYITLIRDPELEAVNTPAFTESVLVHEMAHANALEGGMIQYEEDGHKIYVFAEVGRRKTAENQKFGEFFDEGVADYMSGQYKKEVLGNEFGFIDVEEPWVTFANNDYKLPVASQYCVVRPRPKTPDINRGFVLEGDNICVPVSGFAASAISLLVEREPELHDIILEGFHNVQGLRDFANIVESVQKGIYMRLMKLQQTTGATEFKKGLDMVNSAVS